MNRAAPPVHVLVDRFTVWVAAKAVLWVLALSSLAAWWVGWSGSFSPGSTDLVHGVAMGVSLLLLLAALGLSQSGAVSLRWDGEQWWLGDPRHVGVEPWCVRPRVCLDLGAWMLLYFKPAPDAVSLPHPYRWLALQRWGLAAQWHGLRCALLTQAGRRRGLS